MGRFSRDTAIDVVRELCHAAVVHALERAVDALTRLGDHDEAERYRTHLEFWTIPEGAPPEPGPPHLRRVK